MVRMARADMAANRWNQGREIGSEADAGCVADRGEEPCLRNDPISSRDTFMAVVVPIISARSGVPGRGLRSCRSQWWGW